jgi:hypothetical protein
MTEEIPTTPDVETLLAQLRDPATLLANALGRVHEADALIGAPDDMEPADLALYKVATAFVLDRIARTASGLVEAEQRMMPTPLDFGALDAESLRPTPANGYAPQAVNGVRFTATVTGVYMGRVGDALWLHAPGVGFVCVSGGAAIEFAAVGAVIDVGFSGRVVSATPDHVLCITDGGTGITLPRALITESADE